MVFCSYRIICGSYLAEILQDCNVASIVSNLLKQIFSVIHVVLVVIRPSVERSIEEFTLFQIRGILSDCYL